MYPFHVHFKSILFTNLVSRTISISYCVHEFSVLLTYATTYRSHLHVCSGTHFQFMELPWDTATRTETAQLPWMESRNGKILCPTSTATDKKKKKKQKGKGQNSKTWLHRFMANGKDLTPMYSGCLLSQARPHSDYKWPFISTKFRRLVV
jgi:hypothetical protein